MAEAEDAGVVVLAGEELGQGLAKFFDCLLEGQAVGGQ